MGGSFLTMSKTQSLYSYVTDGVGIILKTRCGISDL